MGQVLTQGTPLRIKETIIKREGKETESWGLRPPNTLEAPEKAPWIVPRTNPLWELGPSQLDREEHCVNCCPYTKT